MTAESEVPILKPGNHNMSWLDSLQAELRHKVSRLHDALSPARHAKCVMGIEVSVLALSNVCNVF